MAAPKGFSLPPAKTKTAKSQQGVFKAYVNSHPTMSGYANAIYKAASAYGIDPVYYASLLWHESFAQAATTGANPETILSPKGAVGLAQIMPLHIGQPIPWAPGQRITRQMLDNPAFSIRFGAYYFAQGVQQTGDYATAYNTHYNPGYPGNIFNDIPKEYVPTTTAKSPTETAQTSVETTAAKAALTNIWAVYRGGKVKFVTAPNPPAGTLKIFDQPLSKGAFLQDYASIQDTYLAYTGKRPSFGQAAAVIGKGLSNYQLQTTLASSPGFVGSPVWKQNAPGYTDVWHKIYGPDMKPDTKAIQNAIVNNLGQAGFADNLRQRADYLKSSEYKQTYVSNENVFRQIYGEPTQMDTPAIAQATLHGYNSDQFASYLRSQPSYASSPEALGRANSLLDALGLLTGHLSTLVPGTPNSIPVKAQTLPTDKRAASAGRLEGLGLKPGII